MNCQWQAFLNVLPVSIRQSVDELGKVDLLELRLRIHMLPELKLKQGSITLQHVVSAEDINYCINAATKYSPWTSESIRDGYITAAGGHRIGLCGTCCYENGELKNMNVITSLCIRIAREFPNISKELYKRKGSILIIGPPATGKTTLLRDLIRCISNELDGAVTVLDERRELFPHSLGQFLFERGRRTDVLSGIRKPAGLDMALRTMSPTVIALDEITNEEDCSALREAANCGVRLIATAHAGSREELMSRPVYRQLIEDRLFHTLVIMHRDKSWIEEGL